MLSTHINADGDGCGSEAALALLLAQTRGAGRASRIRRRGRSCSTSCSKGVSDRSADGARALKGADLLVVLDISDVKRLGTLADAVRAFTGPKLVIDHHVPAAEPPGGVIVADTAACATGELVFDLACVMGLEITPAIARALYTAMLTDTGGFRFSNTSPRCHAVAAQLLAAGVEPEEMYRRIYAQVSVGRLRLLRDTLDTLEVDALYGLSWIALPAGVLEKYDVKRRGAGRAGGASAIRGGHEDGDLLPRPRARAGEGELPQHRRRGREPLRARVRRRRARARGGGDDRRRAGRRA